MTLENVKTHEGWAGEKPTCSGSGQRYDWEDHHLPVLSSGIMLNWIQKDILLSLTFQIQGETKDILQSGRLYKLSINGSKSVEFYHYFCLLFR